MYNVHLVDLGFFIYFFLIQFITYQCYVNFYMFNL